MNGNIKGRIVRPDAEKSRFPVVSLVPNESPDNVLRVRKAWEPVKQLEGGDNGNE